MESNRKREFQKESKIDKSGEGKKWINKWEVEKSDYRVTITLYQNYFTNTSA